ncbi:hypothetical protein [Microseira wollei]|uniref:Uncharacterized protein n=1 Tax=Microseira wollei NIES-4236 TaxID=2530354 RepID=A0AAV3XTS4_9CYAN|nr:hypothetical protein [Microseira wollei]GET43572.1 hypothetical protein MiSe_83970 [Microseira wollei NIES-4236]
MTAKRVPVEVIGVGSAAECLRDIVQAYTEYKIVAEEEQTKRRGIEAWEKATVAQIKANRDALIKYLDRSFDERAKNFRFLFSKVDEAIAKGDTSQLTLALHSITEIAKSSPFKELADLTSVRAALDDPGHEWEF